MQIQSGYPVLQSIHWPIPLLATPYLGAGKVTGAGRNFDAFGTLNINSVIQLSDSLSPRFLRHLSVILESVPLVQAERSGAFKKREEGHFCDLNHRTTPFEWDREHFSMSPVSKSVGQVENLSLGGSELVRTERQYF
jgi:hypothetical protein